MPDISVVIPVYNEEQSLERLCARLFPALDKLEKPYEVIFINDGSRDASQSVLETLYEKHKPHIRVIELMRNAGQHRAILAGFAHVRGQRVVTLDCDLQNPPEEIAALLAEMDKGHDVVGGVRENRHDSAWRKFLSKLSNQLRERITRMKMRDQGCMLRAYRREVVDRIVAANEATPYIPELSWYFAHSPAELPVRHEARHAGRSTYNLSRLIRLNFDLTTASTLAPLQCFTLLGLALCALCTLWLGIIGLQGLLGAASASECLLAFLCWLVSLVVLGIGLVGEYVGRIYLEVRRRPHYVVQKLLES